MEFNWELVLLEYGLRPGVICIQIKELRGQHSGSELLSFAIKCSRVLTLRPVTRSHGVYTILVYLSPSFLFEELFEWSIYLGRTCVYP